MTAKSGHIYCNQALCISYKCICVNVAPLGSEVLELCCLLCGGILLPCYQTPLIITQIHVDSLLHYSFHSKCSLVDDAAERKTLWVDSLGGKAIYSWLKASTISADGWEAFWKNCFSQMHLGRLLSVMQFQLYYAFQDILTVCKTTNVFQCFLRYLLWFFFFFFNPGRHTSSCRALHNS